MAALSLRSRIVFGFLTALSLLFAVSSVTLWAVSNARTESAYAAQGQGIVVDLERTLVAIIDMETGQRGFSLTGKGEFLEPYERSLERLPRLFTALKERIIDPDSLALLTRIEELTARRRRFAAMAIDARRRGGLQAAAGIIARGDGKTLLDQARSLMSELTDRERAKLQARAESAARNNKRAVLAAAVALGLSAPLLLIGSAFLIRSIIRPIRQLVDATEKLGKGDFSHRAQVIRRDELGRLSESFNEMAQALSDFMERENELTRLLERVAFASVSIGDEAIAHSSDAKATLQVIADKARSATAADFAALGIGTSGMKAFDPWVFSGVDERTAAAIGHFPRARGLLGWVARQGQSMRLADLSKSPIYEGLPERHPPMEAFLGVPIRYEGRAVGNLYLAKKPGAKAFTEQEQKAVELLAAHAGVVMENAKLYEEARSERERMRFLADFGARINSSLLNDEILATATGAAVPRMAEFCGIYLLRPDGELTMATAAAADPRIKDLIHRALGEPGSGDHASFAERAARTRESVLVLPKGAQERETRGSSVPLGAIEGRSLIGVPLLVRDRVTGVLALVSKTDHRYVATDLSLAEEIAWRLALALENARLYRHMKKAVNAREDVLAIVSHDLKNPLASISMGAELLERFLQKAHDSAPAARAIHAIQNSCRQMVRMIGDLLDAASVEAGRIQVNAAAFDAVVLLKHLESQFGILAEESGVRLHIVRPADPLPVIGDFDRLLQVFSNLLGNALKFTPRNGEIRVDYRIDGGHVRFIVADTGPGIAARDQEHLFNRYWQAHGTKQRGTGLGLYIAKGIIEAHKGRIWVESAIGRGARFSFTIPQGESDARSQGASGGERRAEPPARLDPGLRILVVDDSPDMRDLLQRFLETEGALVLTADSAEHGARAAQDNRPDLVLTDIEMPGGDGFELLRRIRAPQDETARTPVIALTAHSGAEEVAKIHRAGFDAHVDKPITTAGLAAAIRRVLKSTSRPPHQTP